MGYFSSKVEAVTHFALPGTSGKRNPSTLMETASLGLGKATDGIV
jgi:hypothetical protein